MSTVQARDIAKRYVSVLEYGLETELWEEPGEHPFTHRFTGRGILHGLPLLQSFVAATVGHVTGNLESMQSDYGTGVGLPPTVAGPVTPNLTPEQAALRAGIVCEEQGNSRNWLRMPPELGFFISDEKTADFHQMTPEERNDFELSRCRLVYQIITESEPNRPNLQLIERTMFLSAQDGRVLHGRTSPAAYFGKTEPAPLLTASGKLTVLDENGTVWQGNSRLTAVPPPDGLVASKGVILQRGDWQHLMNWDAKHRVLWTGKQEHQRAFRPSAEIVRAISG